LIMIMPVRTSVLKYQFAKILSITADRLHVF
jgi:hypothetical protein